MGLCSVCKKRTQTYCFVHRRSICERCLTSADKDHPKACQSNCIVKSYHDWIVDNEYDLPPRCTICNRSINDDGKKVARLPCYCLFHHSCLFNSFQQCSQQGQDFATLLCFGCKKPFLESKNSKNAFYSAALSLIQSAQGKTGVAAITAPLPQSLPRPTTSSSFSSSSFPSLSSSLTEFGQTKELTKRNEQQPRNDQLKEREKEREREKKIIKEREKREQEEREQLETVEIESHNTNNHLQTANLRPTAPYKGDVTIVVDKGENQKEKEKLLRRRGRALGSKQQKNCRLDRVFFFIMIAAIIISLLGYFILVLMGYFSIEDLPTVDSPPGR